MENIYLTRLEFQGQRHFEIVDTIREEWHCYTTNDLSSGWTWNAVFSVRLINNPHELTSQNNG